MPKSAAASKAIGDEIGS